MGVARGQGGRITVGLILLAGAGCSDGRPSEPVASTVLPTSTAATSTAPADLASASRESHPRAVRAATRTLRRYLDQWVRRGPGIASRHLVREQRSPAGSSTPRLVYWRIESVDLVRWDARTDFTLYSQAAMVTFRDPDNIQLELYCPQR